MIGVKRVGTIAHQRNIGPSIAVLAAILTAANCAEQLLEEALVAVSEQASKEVYVEVSTPPVVSATIADSLGTLPDINATELKTKETESESHRIKAGRNIIGSIFKFREITASGTVHLKVEDLQTVLMEVIK